jgi:hypothetical protein
MYIQGKSVYLWSTGGSGRACCTAAVLIGRLYGVSAGEALARVQYSVAARIHQVPYTIIYNFM